MENPIKEINNLSLKENLKTTFSSMSRVIEKQEASLNIVEIGIGACSIINAIR